jgi:hypothetical protein
VISRRFDIKEADRRIKTWGGGKATDDNGVLLIEEQEDFEFLEVAHILPHSLVHAEKNAELVFLPNNICYASLLTNLGAL